MAAQVGVIGYTAGILQRQIQRGCRGLQSDKGRNGSQRAGPLVSNFALSSSGQRQAGACRLNLGARKNRAVPPLCPGQGPAGPMAREPHLAASDSKK